MGSVEIRRVTRVPTAVVLHRVPTREFPRVVPASCGRVWEALRAQGLRGGHNVALYRDGGAVVEAGVELVTPFTPPADIAISNLPGGTVAATTYFGPYGGLGAAHDAVHEWAKAAGRALGGVCWEVYGHWQAAWDTDPSQIRTDVYYELADAGGR
jgi:effector-binding domain-containing protein